MDQSIVIHHIKSSWYMPLALIMLIYLHTPQSILAGTTSKTLTFTVTAQITAAPKLQFKTATNRNQVMLEQKIEQDNTQFTTAENTLSLYLSEHATIQLVKPIKLTSIDQHTENSAEIPLSVFVNGDRLNTQSDLALDPYQQHQISIQSEHYNHTLAGRFHSAVYLKINGIYH